TSLRTRCRTASWSSTWFLQRIDVFRKALQLKRYRDLTRGSCRVKWGIEAWESAGSVGSCNPRSASAFLPLLQPRASVAADESRSIAGTGPATLQGSALK